MNFKQLYKMIFHFTDKLSNDRILKFQTKVLSSKTKYACDRCPFQTTHQITCALSFSTYVITNVFDHFEQENFQSFPFSPSQCDRFRKCKTAECNIKNDEDIVKIQVFDPHSFLADPDPTFLNESGFKSTSSTIWKSGLNTFSVTFFSKFKPLLYT